MKIGNGELDIDPAQALIDFRLALQRFDALPESEQKNLRTVRSRTITVRKVGEALSQLGEYSQATPFFEEAVNTHQRLVDADPKDLRNLGDLKRALQGEALSYEYAANPALAAPFSDQRQDLLAAERTLQRAKATVEEILKLTPNDTDRQAELASFQTQIGTIRQLLYEPDAVSLSKSGLATLKDAAGKQASSRVLYLVVTAFLQAEPISLRDPEFTLACAERGVALTYRKTPEWLLLLAQSYHASGQTEKAQSAASEGLALLPAPQPGVPKYRVRKLLEIEARAQ